jgi:hypothetical protein
MLMEVQAFIFTYFFLLAWLQRGAARMAAAVMFAGVAGFIAIAGLMEPDPGDRIREEVFLAEENRNQFEGYAMRSQSVYSALPSRLYEMGVRPVEGALNRYGWIGAGLGSGSQGAAWAAAADLARFGAGSPYMEANPDYSKNFSCARSHDVWVRCFPRFQFRDICRGHTSLQRPFHTVDPWLDLGVRACHP